MRCDTDRTAHYGTVFNLATAMLPISPVEIRHQIHTSKPGKIYNKLKFGAMSQNHVLSHQNKNPHVLIVGLPTFSAFKVCHLVSKSMCYRTANPTVVEVTSFE